MLLFHEGLDYQGFFKKPVYFGGNDSTIIEVPIIDDELAEGRESFYGELTVSGPTQNFTATVNISVLDDEGIAKQIKIRLLLVGVVLILLVYNYTIVLIYC